MKAILLKLTLLIIVCTWLASCKKDDGNAVCRLKTVRIQLPQYDATRTLEYDNQGRIFTVVTSGSATATRTFTYKADSTFITETTTSSTSKYIVVKNTAGNLKEVLVLSSTGGQSIHLHYEYNSAGKLTSQTKTYGSGAPLTYATTYNASGDANYETNTSTASQTIYDYYADKIFQTGDGGSILEFLDYGGIHVTNNHLLRSNATTSGIGGEVITEYEYTFDDAGRIITLTQKIGNQPTTYDYTYSCD